MDTKITYEVQEQYQDGPWKPASYDVDDINTALSIRRSIEPDYPGVKFRIVRKTLTIEVME